MEQAVIHVSWQRAWMGLQAKGTGLELKQRLLNAWSEPPRRYHTMQHLTECLTLASQHLELALEPAEVEMALWFHDAVYNVKGGDNELKSAEWAELELADAGVDPERIGRIRDHILATRHAALPVGTDQQLVVDIDLAILGATPARFEAYERQVREEYRWVPGFLFRRRRRAVLEEFLRREPIYQTARIREMLEDQARNNLADSIRRLKG